MPKYYQHQTGQSRNKIHLMLQGGGETAQNRRPRDATAAPYIENLAETLRPSINTTCLILGPKEGAETQKCGRKASPVKNESRPPELIAERMSQDLPGQRISHKANNQYIYHQNTAGDEPTASAETGPSAANSEKPRSLAPIETRPKLAEGRPRAGHWKKDIIWHPRRTE